MPIKHLIYVDGQEGTTGLKIHEMLRTREDLEVLRIAPERRKDPVERARLINQADLVFLCLPDAASREAVEMITNPTTKVIDTSTAFRADAAWVYGLPELTNGQRNRIRASLRVANPGCHATAFILLMRPLIETGIWPVGKIPTATSITGFSGGGTKMIDQYQSALSGLRGDDLFLNDWMAPRPYALGLSHKHLPEMTIHSGLGGPPVFMPMVGPFLQGLTVSIPIYLGSGDGTTTDASDLCACFEKHYREEPFVRVMPLNDAETLATGFFNVQECNNTNRVDLFVFANGPQVILMARLDNLGKGASGAAVQNMNLMLGLEERAGLVENQAPTLCS